MERMYCSTLFKHDGNYASFNLDAKPLNYVYVYGYSDGDEGALVNMHRLIAILLKEEIDKRLGTTKSRNFVNGGTYSTGAFVQETIIYRPIRKNGEVYDEQLIFTFYSEIQEGCGSSFTPKYKIMDEEVYVKGVGISDSRRTGRFSRFISPLPLQMVRGVVVSQYSTLFPSSVIDSRMKVVSVEVEDLLAWIDVIATMVHKVYFNNQTYEEYISSV